MAADEIGIGEVTLVGRERQRTTTTYRELAAGPEARTPVALDLLAAAAARLPRFPSDIDSAAFSKARAGMDLCPLGEADGAAVRGRK